MTWHRSATGKRIFDLIGAFIGLLLMAIPMSFIAIVIRVRMGAPVLFTQDRAGKYGKPFVIYKFRTMTNERDESGELLPEEIRVTPLGRFLRRTTLDELPELFNVLKGEMSLVGPRPLVTEYVDRYTEYQARRLELKPGLTSLAVIKGRNALDWEERFQFDVWYVENWNLLLDCKILLFTVSKILQREGVTHGGHVVMPEYLGPNEESND